MNELNIGDIVSRKSYGSDILFKVTDIEESENGKRVILKGISFRIEADSPESDLIIQSEQIVNEHNSKMERFIKKKINYFTDYYRQKGKKNYIYRNYAVDRESIKSFKTSIKVLHLDGDEEYLQKCLEQYSKLGINAIGKYIPEREQPNYIYKLLEEHRPDILVLTGHDGVIKGNGDYSNINNYRNSKYFINAVKEARRFCNDKDNLVIFAGACQSLYSQIIEAGANYASSPKRILIHALDPVIVAFKIATHSAEKLVKPSEVLRETITGIDGIGGIQTRGKYRYGFPIETLDK